MNKGIVISENEINQLNKLFAMKNEYSLKESNNKENDIMKMNDKIIAQVNDIFAQYMYYAKTSNRDKKEVMEKLKKNMDKLIASSPTPGTTTFFASKFKKDISIPNYLIYNTNSIIKMINEKKNEVRLTREYNEFPENSLLIIKSSSTISGNRSTFGMSTGGKIGLGAGCLVLLIIIAVVFMMMKKKKAAKSSVAAAFGFRRRR
jgi:hypothetical protein